MRRLADERAEGVLLFDIGGGSSEIVWLKRCGKGVAGQPSIDTQSLQDRMRHWTSLRLGVVSLAERFGGRSVSAATFDDMVGYVDTALGDFAARAGDEARCSRFHLLGTSGTVTTLAGVYLNLQRYDRRRVDGLWMSSHDVDAAIARMRAMSYTERVAHGCIGPDRADLVLAGCAIFQAIRRAFPARYIRIADRGLREGLLMQMMTADGVWGRDGTDPGVMTTAKGGAGTGGREGGRSLKTRVKTARKRSLSSTLWLSRQLNDPYVARAKRDGYRSRAAYKLLEIDEKHHLLKRGQRLVDLGAAPGGWSQVAAKVIGAESGAGQIVAIDLLEMEPLPGVAFTRLDFTEADAPAMLMELIGGRVDGVLSDMAANAVGHRKTDHLKIVALVEMAAAFALDVLAPGGFFIAKVLQGGTEADLLTTLKRHFKDRSSRQARCQSLGFRRTLCLGDGLSRRLPRRGTGQLTDCWARATGYMPFSTCPRISPALFASVWTLKYMSPD